MRYLELGHNTIRPGIFNIIGYNRNDPRGYDSIGDGEILDESRFNYKNIYHDIEFSVYYPEVAEKILSYSPLLNKTFIRALEVSDHLDIPLYRVLSTLKHLAWECDDTDLYRFDYAHNVIFNMSAFKKVYIEYRAAEMYF